MADHRLGQFDVLASWLLDRDEGIVGIEGGRAIYMHPLAVVQLKHPDDPLARLDEAMKVLVARAHARLDDAVALAVLEQLGAAS